MKKFLPILFMFCFTTAFGQQSQEVKDAVDTFNAGNLDNGIALMHKIVDKESTLDNWNMLVEMYYTKYIMSTKPAEQLKATFGLKPLNSVECKNDLTSACRTAGLYSQSYYASMYLREFYVDYYPDTNVSHNASDEREKAEDYFDKKDYHNAKECYKNAIALHPGYYKATLYLGDCYWDLNNMDSAIYFFGEAEKMHEDLLEPKKHLVDALAEANRNAEAEKKCIEGICIYPDESMFLKLHDLAERDSKKFDKHWVKRGCDINRMGKENLLVLEDKTWSDYQLAKNEIKSYCDSNGVVVKPNKLTKDKYLEVYSYRKMLDNTTSDEFAFARKMRDAGLLDCYVFISVFHYDMYPQFKDFAKNNKDRIAQYINKYLIQ